VLSLLITRILGHTQRRNPGVGSSCHLSPCLKGQNLGHSWARNSFCSSPSNPRGAVYPVIGAGQSLPLSDKSENPIGIQSGRSGHSQMIRAHASRTRPRSANVRNRFGVVSKVSVAWGKHQNIPTRDELNRPGFVGDFILWKRGWRHGQTQGGSNIVREFPCPLARGNNFLRILTPDRGTSRQHKHSSEGKRQWSKPKQHIAILLAAEKPADCSESTRGA
jgi:hypothetical protein